MDRPLTLPPPDSVIERVHDFARDLAWGVADGLWEPIISQDTHSISLISLSNGPSHRPLDQLLGNKWAGKFPSMHMLKAFGYIHLTDRNDNARLQVYTLQEKAFQLLEKPTQQPGVFISYRRAESTPFALLIEARLRLVGKENIFIDKLLEIGGEWRNELEVRVRESHYFVIIVGPRTFESEWMHRELNFALDAGNLVIPLLQPGLVLDESVPQAIRDRQYIRVERETADGYEIAINKLLNRMGYATY